MHASQVSTTGAPAGGGVAGSHGGDPAPRIPEILARLLPRGFLARLRYNLFQWGRDYPASRWLFRLARFLPIVTFGDWVLVFRYDEVREVLGRHHDFEVPFGEKMEDLNRGPNFLLGMPEGPQYWRCQQLVMEAFSRADVPEIVAPMAARYADEEIAKAQNKGGTLDAVRDLLTLVATRICEDYYGVPIANKADFADWTMAMSVFIFGPPKADPAYERAAREGGELVRPVIDCAISRAKATMEAGEATPKTVLKRLIEMQKREEQAGRHDLTDLIIRSYLIGMITGFVPTSTIATGNMLEMLLRRKDFMERARTAALAGDDDLLKRCLFEALRFKPINPGPFRICTKDTAIAAGTPRETKVRKGQVLFASTQSAMLDGDTVKDPHLFDPGRPAQDYMVFGYGLHWCVGAFIAEAHATQVFKALLLQPGLKRADKGGQLEVVGVLPLHLEVEFQVPPAGVGTR